MDSQAVAIGGVPTGTLAVVVGRFLSLPDLVFVGFLAGFVTGYVTESWGDEGRDGAAAGAVAGIIAFVALAALSYGSDTFGPSYGFLFVLVPVFALEALLSSLISVRVFGSAVSRTR